MAGNAEVYVLKPADDRADGAYGEFDGPVALDELPAFLPKGSVVGIRPRPGAQWSRTVPVINAAADRVVNAPLALWTDLIGRRTAVRFALSAALLGVRAVVHTRRPAEAELRSMLTEPTGWPDLVVGWVRRRVGRLDPRAAMIIRTLAAERDPGEPLEDLARRNESTWRTWSRALKATGLGNPGPWRATLQAVKISLVIQRFPERKVAEIAHSFGYSGMTALSNRIDDVIGARPRDIRGKLGWQWMLADAVRRAKVMRRNL